MNTQVIEFLTSNPNSNKTAITEATGIKGLQLFNLLKQMLKDAQITSSGDGNETTYSIAEATSEESTESKDEVILTDGPTSEQPIVVEQPSNAEATLISEKEKVLETKDKPQEAAVTKTTERDNSKFLFNGIEMNKGQLVRSVVAQYVADNGAGAMTVKKLKEVFPDILLKRFGIFQDEEKAREISGKKYDRYFFKEEHVIKLKDKKVVVCNQWTAENLKPFLEVTKQLGYEIK